jgi:hypothetical protein
MSEKIPHPSFPARLGLALGIFAVLATTIAVAGIFIRRHHGCKKRLSRNTPPSKLLTRNLAQATRR